MKEKNMTTAVQWTRKKHLIRFELVSNGKSREEWVKHFQVKRIPISNNAKKMLEAYVFKPTPAGTIHHVRILRGTAFSKESRNTRQICKTAQELKFRTPHPEIAPLIRDKFSDDDIRRMGLEEIATFHTPICGRFLDIDTETGMLESAPAGPDDMWHEEHGFAFEEQRTSLRPSSEPRKR